MSNVYYGNCLQSTWFGVRKHRIACGDTVIEEVEKNKLEMQSTEGIGNV